MAPLARYLGATALLAVGLDHLEQCYPRALLGDPDHRHTFPRELRVGIAGGAVAGLLIGETSGLFGFMEDGYRSAIVLSLVFEGATIILLGTYFAYSMIRPKSRKPSLVQRRSAMQSAPRLAASREHRRAMLEGRMRVRGLFETHLTVADLARSVTFYRDVVGLPVALELSDRGAAFHWIGQPGQAMLGLWSIGSAPMGMQLHIAFDMSLRDVLAAPGGLVARGVPPLSFFGEPTDEPSVIGWMPAAAVYFRDRDGHLLEYLTMLEGPATWDSQSYPELRSHLLKIDIAEDGSMAIDPQFFVDFHDRPDGSVRAHEVRLQVVQAAQRTFLFHYYREAARLLGSRTFEAPK